MGTRTTALIVMLNFEGSGSPLDQKAEHRFPF